MSREFDFYIVPTPIGNMSDITLRAIEVLKTVDCIACEDTRTTQKLLNYYKISTKCISYHKYNEKERVELFLKELNSGKKIALVSDAGTPHICDPGAVIIKNLTENGFSVTSLPGACAITTFLSAVPRENDEFSFIGFIPKSETQIIKLVQKYAFTNLVFYDSPERILKTLSIIKSVRGDILVAVGRELSKLFEERTIDTISNTISHYNKGVKGEIVCMVSKDEREDETDIKQKIMALKNKGFKDKDISVILSELYNINKNEVYKISLAL